MEVQEQSKCNINKINIFVLILLIIDFIFPNLYPVNHGLEYSSILILLGEVIGVTIIKYNK